MGERVQIKVQAKEDVRFPGVCVNCARPASESMRLKQKSGRITREIDVPLCVECAAIVAEQSEDEERLVRLKRVIPGFAGAALALILLLIIPGDMSIWLRILLALLAGGLAAGLVIILLNPAIDRAVAQDKQDILKAAQLESFSWRSATFVFNNETFAESFKAMNESSLMDS